MQYRGTKVTSSKPSVYDNWKPWNQKFGKQQDGGRSFWGFIDSPHKYWERKPKVTSSPKPIYDYQHHSFQNRHKLILKNRLITPRNYTKIEPVRSKKSIPDHALMKNLLAGLSIFDDDRHMTPSTKSSIHRHKSMGNLREINDKKHEIKPSVKSSVDFTDTSQIRRDFNDEDFRNYCRNYTMESQSKLHKHTVNKIPERYFAPKSCTDSNCPFNSNRYIGDGCYFNSRHGKNEHNKVTPGIIQKRNIVQERKQFFEKKEKAMQEECRLSKYKPRTVFKEPDCDGGESVMELYRNAKIVGSATTLSRSKHSKIKLNQSKAIELFHPEYNFDNKSSNGDVRQSIIESIRTKIFKTPSTYSDEDYADSERKYPKFPKETRKAMSIIMNQKRTCRCRAKQFLSVETQTSPVSSKHSFFESGGLPCTKNLLCSKGYHNGRCEEEILRRLESVCSDDCLCKRDQYSSEALRSSFYAPKSRIHTSFRPNLPNDTICSNCPNCRCGDYDSSIDDNNESFIEYNNKLDLHASDFIDCEVKRSEEIYKERASYVSCPTSPKMNGMNGHSNGDFNGCGDIITQNQQRGCWTIGLINSKYRYLTAETFGFKINANGTSLKKKQIWTLEPDQPSGETCIYLKSHLDKYLAVDSFGNITCESEEKEPGCKFQICVSEDGKGRWAFKNVVRGYFLGSTSDKLTCTAKVPTDAEFWHIHLAARPQVNLRSVGRKRFAHLSENLDEIHVDANIPWGEDTLFTLEFHADEDGKYALHTCNNKYLSNGGKLVDKCNEDCLFSAEYHSGQLALRDRNGQYLSPIGSKAVLKTRSNTVTKDELFSLEDSLPQASFVAALNARYVSVKQGVDVTANQDEISDHETFQLEFDWTTKRWYIRTMQDKYWTLETGGGIQASGDKRSSNALFDLVWQNDGSLAFRANNGRYVITKRSGHLYATSDTIDDTCKYFFYLINRPILVLKCEQGFVGYKSAGNPKLECNKATYECIQVERADKGVIHFKGQNGKYWHVDSESVTADSDVPENFYLELREPTRLCIKTANGNYLTASKNGVFRLGDTSIENATQWEY